MPAWLAITAAMAIAGEAPQMQPQFSVSSMLRLEHFGQAVTSPDGRHLAYEYLAAYETLKDFSVFGFRPDQGFNGSRIYWREAERGGAEEVIADDNGATRFWTADFSPDSSRLAFFAGNSRGATTRVYDRRTRKVLEFNIAPNLRYEQSFPLVWISAEEFVIAALPPGSIPQPLNLRGSVAKIIADEWQTAFAGKKSSAQVWFSGAEQPEKLDRAGELLRVNVTSGSVTSLASGDFVGLELSPSGQWLAALQRTERVVLTPGKAPDGPAPILRAQLRVFSLSSSARRTPASRLDVAPGSVRWDDRADVLVFYARQYEQRWREGRPWRWPMDAEHPRCMSELGDLEYAAFGQAWLYGRQASIVPTDRGVLVYAGHAAAGPPAQNGWYVVSADAPPRLITPGLQNVNGTAPYRQQDGWAIIADGRPWLIRSDRAPEAMSWREGEVWNEIRSRRFDLFMRQDPGAPRGLFHVKRGEREELVDLSHDGSSERRIAYPGPTATLASVSDRFENAAFTELDDTATQLKLVTPAGAPQLLRTINTRVSELHRPIVKRYPARTTDGVEVTCSIILPPEWRPGIRLPAVVHAYPTTQETVADQLTVTAMSSGNPLVFSGYGYAIIIPNYPLRAQRTPGKPFARLTEFNNLAVDEADRIGYIDPTRVGLWGASFGGEAVFYIAGETERYRVAMALSGVVNYVSRAGQYTGRYFAYPDEWVPGAMANYYESPGSVTYIEGPGVWLDPDRYLRASPLYNVGRIRTPIALVYGEMDSTGVAQFDEAFAALTHLGKDGMYLRYWGEDHGIYSPANVRDVWARTMEWFDRHMDIARNNDGGIEYENGAPRSRGGGRSWSVEDFLAFEARR